MAKHYALKRGAAVRLHLYMPARVLSVRVDPDAPGAYARVVADCVVTLRRNGGAGIGPHGYRHGERVTVLANCAIPRDCIRTRRGSGALYFAPFDVIHDDDANAAPFEFASMPRRERWTTARPRGTVHACRFELLHAGRWRRLYSDHAESARSCPHFLNVDGARVLVQGVAP